MAKGQIKQQQIKIDKKELIELMKFFPTRKEVADWFDVTEVTLGRFLKDQMQTDFETLRDKSFVRTRVAIKRAQIKKALDGDNTMLIWCGKQYLGQRDVAAVQVNTEGDAGFKIVVEDYTKKEK